MVSSIIWRVAYYGERSEKCASTILWGVAYYGDTMMITMMPITAISEDNGQSARGV